MAGNKRRGGLSLRHNLLRWLIPPMIIIVTASGALSYYIALRYVDITSDRYLLNTALAVASQVKVINGKITLDLPHPAMEMLLWDQYDKVVYKVTDGKGKHVSGAAGLGPAAWSGGRDKKQFYYGDYRGEPVRVAALFTQPQGAGKADGMVTVQIAETLNKRQIVAGEILAGVFIPQLLLVAITAVLAWRGVSHGLGPVDDIRNEVASRSWNDLSPLKEEKAPVEVAPLLEAINGLLKRNEDALAARHRFISNAAHQLRTPLAGIKTQTELALRQSVTPETADSLNQIKLAVERLIHVTNQLLSLARVEPQENIPPSFAVFDMGAAAMQTTSHWAARALDKGIDVGFDQDDGPLMVNGDKGLIREMLDNLVDNAIRYIQPSGVVTVKVRKKEGCVALCVEDNGRGIPESERERVFERFYRMPESTAPGCGLGLAIVRQIADMHGAQVNVRNNIPSGAIFEVEFPAAGK
ncbi:MAG: sensor histidine kinase [Nitrospinae bacterium]|nr:sensor histidine kinase [Nitrospinota bacterium]